MKRLFTLLIFIFAAALAAPRPAAAADGFDQRCRAAMAPYYAALLTSARGDTEGTLRHVVVLRARWSNLQSVPVAGRPAWAAQASGAASVLDTIASRIDAARQKALGRDLVGAHAELETIRALLRDARAHAGVRTFDDAVTDYHEAMERLTGRAGLHNEIALNADDYAAIQEQVARAATAWAEIQSAAGAAKTASGWPGLSGATEKALGTLRSATSARDMGATQTAAEALKARYFELLAILARA